MVLKLKKEKIIVTSALPYANGNIHLGHLSGAYLPADIFVRYNRLINSDILYVCGSDEHGVPITITADNEKVAPQDIINRYHEGNKAAFEKFGMSFDIYSRTSIPTHHKTAQDFFKSYHNQGILSEKKSLQFYDEKAGMFLPDRYVEGTCPKCGFEEARSDECERCGDLYDPSELINPKSKISGGTPQLKGTSHWYFPLGKYQERLEDYIDKANKIFGWKNNVLQYCKGWFKDGLKDRAVTRDLDWGVKVPLDSSEGKVLYVWFEAVLGYISATKELFRNTENPEKWKEYWQDENTRYIAFIGKDNIVFHTIIFPAMLMAWNDANDDKFILPVNVPANEFLNFEGKKFSKSRGWGIDVNEFLEIFPTDSLRYTLASNAPENKDTDFQWKEFQAKNNSELADILGNFINRTFIFAKKHFDEKVPARGELEKIDVEMLTTLEKAPIKIGKLLEKYKVKEAVFEMMNLARAGNKYFNDSEPWVSVKTNKDKTATTVNICLQTISTLAEVFAPVIPFSSEKIFKMLNIEIGDWNESGKREFEVGHQLNKSEILFPKIEDKTIETEILKWSNPANYEEEEEVVEEEKAPEITFDDFMKVDLKVTEIISAEKVPKSKKLLKLQVKIGKTKRQVVAGIAQSYEPENLLGKKVVMVANLKPAKLFGIESQGMILAIEDETGKLNIVEVENSLSSGLKIR